MNDNHIPNNNLNEHELLAAIIISLRESRKWTQETLEEISKVNLRTIQRIETGIPTSVDTRRALAVAFEYEDIDVFNSPTFINDFLKWGKEVQQFIEETIEKPLEIVCSGKQLRELIEANLAFAFDELGELTKEAEDAFAQLKDYVKDYSYIHDEYTATQKLEINEELQNILNMLAEMGLVIGTFIRKFYKNDANIDPFLIPTVYFVIGSKANFPKKIRVQKKVQMKF